MAVSGAVEAFGWSFEALEPRGAGHVALERPCEELSRLEWLRDACVELQVRRFEDFVASYDWQRVERWHLLPPGLEISMDSGSARIPEPWPWQVRVEEQEQRVSVQRSSSMAELLEALGLSDSTHEVAGEPKDCLEPFEETYLG